MSGEERRNQIIHILQSSDTPISGVKLAKMLDVSRQVIVQDVALLRAKDICIHSTNRGYVIDKNQETLRVFKVIHTEEETAEELQTIIDLGGWVKDVFVYHKTYGVIRGELNIHSRYDIEQYIAELKSSPVHIPAISPKILFLPRVPESGLGPPHPAHKLYDNDSPMSHSSTGWICHF